MAGTYVPGYGYVSSGSAGTSGSVTAGPKAVDKGQRYVAQPSTSDPYAALGVTPSPQAVANQQAQAGTGTQPQGYERPAGVAYPLNGYGDWGQQSGYQYGVRQGSNPDARELYPYGYGFRGEGESTDSWLSLDPGYRDFLDTLAKNPNVGSSQSTGRMLWERLNNLAAESTKGGDMTSPQLLAAKLAYSAGVSPVEGRDVSSPTSSGGPYGGGGGGYSGGGGGGGGSVSLTNPATARGLLMQTMQNVLGRNPTDTEYADFIDTLKQTQMANPQTVSVEGGNVVQSGGTDPSVIALEFAQAADDYKSQQSNQYYNAFMAALGGNA